MQCEAMSPTANSAVTSADDCQPPIASPYNLIGLPYRLGGNGTDGIDCIHVVYQTLQCLNVPTPAFKQTWYQASPVAIARDLLRWGERINEATYDGDVVLLKSSAVVFGVVWDRGILVVSEASKQVQWHPLERLRSNVLYCFRSRNS